MKWDNRIYVFFVVLLIGLTVITACQSKDEGALENPEMDQGSAPASEPELDGPTAEEPETAVSEPSGPAPTDTPEPEPQIIETLTADIGAEGGGLTSSDGAMELYFPPEALPEITTVAIVLREAAAADGAVQSPVLEISLTPELAAPLTNPAILTFHGMGEAGARYGRLMTLSGSIEAPEGDAPDAIAYWQPLDYTQVNEDGGLQLWLASFSTFAILDERPGDCSDAAPAPPPETPDAYAYVGRAIIVDQTLTGTMPIRTPDPTTLITTMPPGRPGFPDDKLVVQRQDVDGCGQVTAVDIFTPIYPTTPPPTTLCQPTDNMLEPPEAPPGRQHYSTEIFVGGVLSDTIMTEDAPPPPANEAPIVTVIRSAHSDGNQVCSTEVRHTYTPLPQGQSDTMNPDCIPGDDLLTPTSNMSGYNYVGRSVVINGVYATDLSTTPYDRMPSPQDIVNPASSTTTSNGVLICESSIIHTFEPADASQSCLPDFVATASPGPFDSYTYQGYTVFANGEPYPDMSTLPPIPPGAQDVHVVNSYSTTPYDGGPICANNVDHLYKPEPQGTCVILPEMWQPPAAPACYRAIGSNAVVNHTLIQSNAPLDRPAKATDMIYTNSQTTTVNGTAACNIIVAHIFEKIECAPPEFTITSDMEPFTFDDERGTNLFFPPEANLSEADRAYLMSISIWQPFDGEDGSLSITLPPGVQVSSEGDQVTIRTP